MATSMMPCSSAIAAAAAFPQPQGFLVVLRLRSRGARSIRRPVRCSYNGWGDLAAEPDGLPSFPLQPSLLLLPLLLLLLLPIPPLPILAAAFAAGFATRHLAAPAPAADSHRLAQISSSSDPALLLHATNQLRDAARLAAPRTTLRDALKDAAAAFFASSPSPPRKKPPKASASAAAETTITTTPPQPQQQQEEGGNGAQAQHNQPPSVRATPIALDMLPFDMDVHDAGRGFTAQDDDGVVSKHSHGRNSCFQQGTRIATDSMEPPLLEKTLEIRDRSYRLKIERRGGNSQPNEAQQMRASDHIVGNPTSSDGMHDETSIAMDSDDEEFSHNVAKAAEILSKARECMMARDDEEAADALLYKSARLLSTAVALRPSSLVAVGQLGNTYLLHGELKLKVSRELRTLLANSTALLNGRSRSRKLDRRILSRENISSALVDVCEECESLLVEAGRSYRMALSIDSGDVKALYNWGLALIFRAQLLADIGPEAAVDADRVYLAAIDKFDAMLSRSNTYAPEALYRWGIALQQRSYLRSGNNKEKIRLLEQAKSMFEDVLYVEADNKTVREALSSCITELNYYGRWL